MDERMIMMVSCLAFPLLEYCSWCDSGAGKKDLEGMQTMQILGKNMAFFLKCKEAGLKAGITMPKQEMVTFTNFIRE